MFGVSSTPFNLFYTCCCRIQIIRCIELACDIDSLSLISFESIVGNQIFLGNNDVEIPRSFPMVCCVNGNT